jgi:hypothetical protein
MNLEKILTDNYSEYIKNYRNEILNLTSWSRRPLYTDEEKLQLFPIYFSAIERKWKTCVDVLLKNASVDHILLGEYPRSPKFYVYLNNHKTQELKHNRIILLDCVPIVWNYGKLTKDMKKSYNILAVSAMNLFVKPKLEYIKKKKDGKLRSKFFVLYKRHWDALQEIDSFEYFDVKNVGKFTKEENKTTLKNKRGVGPRIAEYLKKEGLKSE